eukprot:3778310-Amphidinium_carterae.1
MAAGSTEQRIVITDYNLEPQYLEYMTVIEGDTEEDELRCDRFKTWRMTCNRLTTISTGTSDDKKNLIDQNKPIGKDNNTKDTRHRWITHSDGNKL